MGNGEEREALACLLGMDWGIVSAKAFTAKTERFSIFGVHQVATWLGQRTEPSGEYKERK